jgi:hypothetical protein
VPFLRAVHCFLWQNQLHDLRVRLRHFTGDRITEIFMVVRVRIFLWDSCVLVCEQPRWRYDIFLKLEATIRVSKKGEKAPA